MKRTFLLSFFLLIIHGSRGQDACDSLEIVSIRYSPFNGDSLLEVHVKNHSQDIFNYPGFLLLDMSGDTVAKEDVGFFGIGTEQTHAMYTYDGQPSGNSVAGTLKLYTLFFDSLQCEFPGTFDLCPSGCEKFYIGFGNAGLATNTGVYSWLVTDSLDQVAGTGSFILDSIDQWDYDSLCLWPGNHHVSITADTSSQVGQIYFSFGPENSYLGIFQNLPSDFTGFDTSLVLYSPCIQGPTGFSPATAALDNIVITASEKTIHVTNRDGAPIEAVAVFDLMGRNVAAGRAGHNSLEIDMQRYAAGIYTVRVRNAEESLSGKIMLE